ncbi:Cation-transporting ATPase [Aphelenchoides besseyi]|nr:Cation-transporting ATPase [Aphelenchoides besseyi]
MSVDTLVDSISTYRRRSPLTFGYGGPFAILYGLWFYYWTVELGVDEWWELGCIVTSAIGLLQVLTVLFCYWFVEVNCVFTCSRVADPTQATLAKVVPQPNNGWTELVPINRTKLPDGSIRIWLSFQKVVYSFNDEKREFEALHFDTRQPLDHYFDHKGFESEEAIRERAMVYGDNEMEMTIPKFMELFIERSTAPFFVFQVFCVGLWCCEGMLYYSLFTLMMLMTFEATVVKQQLKNMAEVRNMGNKPYEIYAYRNRRWNRITSNKLVCGDIISIGRSADEKTVPCDLLLIRGQCIVDESMLTGESVPQMKESIEEIDRRRDFDFHSDGRLHVIYGGTKVVQHTPPGKTDPGMKSPDNGCICYVLRTGFNTSQGQLLRTILFGVKRVTANNLETFAFILFLMIFAVAAAAYVWVKGSEDENRNRYKLLLECSLIITSVIPPELPIELSLAVNNSLIALHKLGVFCTEPFRIPFAGKVSICCFDKTGTLTTDNLVVEGIAGLDSNGKPDNSENEEVAIIRSSQDAHFSSVQVLAACQSLTRFDEELVGDPLEKACLSWIDWNLSRNESVIPKKSKLHPLKIFQRYHFSSQLKRMTVIAGYVQPGMSEPKHLVVVKGAPETLKPMYASAPSTYDRTYQRLAQAGARVLALGIRELGSLTHQEIRTKKREDFERDLEFAGFVVISCPLKPDTKSMIKEIVDSSHIVTMITGDNPLTACHVGSVLHFTKKSSATLILDEPAGDSTTKWSWKSVDNEVVEELVPKDKKALKAFVSDYELCLTGVGYDYLASNHESFLNSIIAKVRIFARMSPKQKELVINRLKALGYVTLMCGDGTNDVGALKHSNVGVALLSHPYDATKESITEKVEAREKKVAEVREKAKEIREQQSGAKRPTTSATGVGPRRSDAPVGSRAARTNTSISKTQERLNQLLKELEEEDSQVIRLGDASVAAPFTSKFTSIQSICHVIKQGRCTLVVTLQMFKILALNALVLAYSQSVLYLDGVKFSDYQATIQGLLLAACFFFICRSEPLKTLSKQRPMPNIFNAYTLLTVTLQFAVHFVCLYVVSEHAHAVEPRPEKLDLEAEFKPNLLNSAIYVMSMALQMCTFAVNYRGRPFMASLIENKPLLYSILSSGFAILILASNTIPEFSAKFEIVTLPDEFRNILVCCVVGDLVVCYVIDRLLNFVLGDMRVRTVT